MVPIYGNTFSLLNLTVVISPNLEKVVLTISSLISYFKFCKKIYLSLVFPSLALYLSFLDYAHVTYIGLPVFNGSDELYDPNSFIACLAESWLSKLTNA